MTSQLRSFCRLSLRYGAKRIVRLGRQARLDYVNFGTYVARI